MSHLILSIFTLQCQLGTLCTTCKLCAKATLSEDCTKCTPSIKILIVRVCVMGGQQKRFDLETQGAVSLAIERKKLDIGMYCERLSRHELHAQTLAYWTDNTKTRRQWVLACGSL